MSITARNETASNQPSMDVSTHLMAQPLNQAGPLEGNRNVAIFAEKIEGQLFWEKFSHMYPFGQNQTFLIPVTLCDCAPAHYVYRSINKVHYKYLMSQFTSKPHVVDMIADLVPYDVQTKKMLTKDEIVLSKVLSYRYYVVSGQHSILVARTIVEAPTCPKHLRDCYSTRNCRILGAQDYLETLKLSRFMNQLHQEVMVKTPYQDALSQARKQWEYFGCPPKPTGGHSIANSKWKVIFVLMPCFYQILYFDDFMLLWLIKSLIIIFIWLNYVIVVYYSFKHVDLLTCLGTCYVGIHGSNKSYIGASQCKK